MMDTMHHEKYREEFSMSVVAACDVTERSAAVSFYDKQLDRLIARSVIPVCRLDEENVSAEISRLIFTSMRTHNIPASAVSELGFAAPHRLADALEEYLDPADMFLRPDAAITVLPFVSMYADSRFAASLSAISMKKGTFIASLGKTLDLAFFDGEILHLTSVVLQGAFDASAIESGVACEYGAIDEVRRESDKTLCYCVLGDVDACGIASSAVLDAVSIMTAEGIIDADGIMTDRDLFYLGEDYYVSQSDIRVVQSDKAKAAAAIRCFLKAFGQPEEVYLCGDALAQNGLKQLTALGVLPEEIAEQAKYCRSYVEQGIYRYLTNEDVSSQLDVIIRRAESISYDNYEDFDDLYIANLSF